MKKIKTKKAEEIREKYESINPYLNERSRRIWAATEVKIIGRGGQSLINEVTGLDFKTIKKGLEELGRPEKERVDLNRIRKKGGGRKGNAEKDKTLISEIEKLVESGTRGDPESPLLWCCKSTRNIADELNRDGHRGSHSLIARELQKKGYSLQGNKKTKEGGDHKDRDGQFKFINKKTQKFLEENEPAISVDTKKKENIGNFKNEGKEYYKKGQAPEVNVYDFIDKTKGKVSPYGVYDLLKNDGWVSVGISYDTAQFAVNSIRSWWYEMGQAVYPNAKKLYINADGGGSNGWRVRLWKTEIQKLANELKLEIHVSHFPPGTSKWNKIEHRMFSFISKNWRGKPLVDRATVVNLIGNTKTKAGLKIKAKLDENIYEKGLKVSDKELSEISLKNEDFHGEWNYIIYPQF